MSRKKSQRMHFQFFLRVKLGPFSKERHDSAAEQHRAQGVRKFPIGRFHHFSVKEEFMCKQLWNKFISYSVSYLVKKKIQTSTSPVYRRMPELSASRTPLTIEAVALPGLYAPLIPSPMAIPMGVVIPYKMAPTSGIQLNRDGSCRLANRDPTPNPSNVSASSS